MPQGLPPGFVLDTPAAAPPQPGIRPVFTAPSTPIQNAAEGRAQAAEGRANVDQSLQEAAARRDEERLRLATDEAARKAVERQQGVDATEAERKAGAFLIRALGSNEAYEESGVGARGLIAQSLQDNAPNLTNVLFNSPERQTANSAQDEFIAASLRQDSGAAIPPEEMERQRRIYFAMPGDSQQALEQKRQARIRAIEGLRQSAGRLEAGAEERYQRLVGANARESVSASREEGGQAEIPDQLLDAARDARRITPELEEAAHAARPYGEVLQSWGYNEDGRPYPIYGPPSDARANDGGALQTVDAGMRGAADVLTIGLADEIAAAGETLFGGGTMAANLANQRAVDEYDTENNSAARLAGQIGGGFLLPAGRAGGALKTGGVGAAYGGAYGFGSGDGDIGDRLAGAGTGALIGGGVGAAFGGASRLLSRPRGGGGGTGPTGREVFDAGQRIGVTPMAADVGGSTTRLMTAGFGATPGGVSPITKAAQGVTDDAMSARDRVAQLFGVPQEAEAAGEAATRGALKFRGESRDRVGRMYRQAEERAGDTQITPTRAMETLEANIQELSAIPGASEQVRVLQGLRDELTKLGPLTVNGVRGMRTQLRDRFMKEGLVGSDIERRVYQIVDSASEDLAEGLAESGLTEASAMFRQADSSHRQRMQTMNDVIMPIIGKRGEKSGEQVFKALQSAAQGNNSRFTQFMDSLPEGERNTVAASIIAGLGRGSAAEGGAFSLPKFFTDWNKLGESAKKAVLSPEARSALNDLATVAEGTKRSQGYLNRSNTGLVLTSTGTASLAMDSFATMGATLAGQYAVGKLLASPAVTRQLVKIDRAKTPQARARLIDGLSSIATRTPVIANDVLGLQGHLLRAISQSPTRAAASDDRKGGPASAPDHFPKPLIPGTLSADIRYQVPNADGTISTVRTISVGTEDGEVLIPTVVAGRVVSDDEAISHFEATGEHFGIFRNPVEATAHAKMLHRQHEQRLFTR